MPDSSSVDAPDDQDENREAKHDDAGNGNVLNDLQAAVDVAVAVVVVHLCF